ncbi:conserved hypothetical protein [Histoplasma mississippiense (nom. inval.)]|uniref:conserved hypothetical protein n=1 Tax=Ajellomyces capsulatus (strain NAm1 / WU24) TaxID=2059318 RepID=UPI000157C09A|nr:conserved hypothetical protein [Histoplasma mississippiense (nom. inval.)]EDN06878.1 conserved hypothetical protein [Histoplasma mississippiense (nom. inval.)]
MAWVTGPNPFVILALVEAEDFGKRGELVKTLTKHKEMLAELSAKEPANKGEKRGVVSSAAKLLLERVGKRLVGRGVGWVGLFLYRHRY